MPAMLRCDRGLDEPVSRGCGGIVAKICRFSRRLYGGRIAVEDLIRLRLRGGRCGSLLRLVMIWMAVRDFMLPNPDGV